MFAANTSKNEDASTHDNNRGTDKHSIDTDKHNMDMERDRRKQAPVVLDERRRHIQKENPAKSKSQLSFSLAISFLFNGKSLYFPFIPLLPFSRQY